MTRTASCQCRGFRVVVEAEPDTVGICHCQICQRRTGVPLTCNAYFPKSKVRLEGEQRKSIPETVQSDANCTTTSARPAAQRSAGLSICVQISLVSQLVASTTGVFRLQWRRSGRRRCALGQRCQRAFSTFRVLDRFRARVKRFHMAATRASARETGRPACAGAVKCEARSISADPRSCSRRLRRVSRPELATKVRLRNSVHATQGVAAS
jgi:hypothetical protein